MYILDTCAIKGISRKQLESAIRNGADLSVCPRTCFELASHLVETAEDNCYAKARGNFLKCMIPRILDDSAVRWADRVDAQQNINAGRRDDRDLLVQMLEIVSETRSLDDLHAKYLRYPDGVLCPLVDCGKVFESILRTEEAWYVDRMRRLLSGSEFLRSPNGQYQVTKEILLANLVRVGRGMPEDLSISLGKAISKGLPQAPYIGYMLYRLYRAKNSGRNDIDRNDYEDAIICLAIDVHAGDVLVTDDKGTIPALRHTTAHLQLMECVMSKDDFVRQVCS